MSKILLSIKDLSIGFKKNDVHEDRVLVKNISFDLIQGKTLALVGESGSGKSITAFSILGLLAYPIAYHPSGSITYYENNEEHPLLNKSEKYLSKFRGLKIGMVFQEPLSALNPLHSVEQQIAEPLLVHTDIKKSEIKDRVISLLELVEFKDGAERLKSYPHQLSGGQRQRVMIAQALACNPKILIADEPTTALDVTIQANIIDLLKRLSKTQNMATLLISHDLQMVKKLADDVCVMKEGEIVESGSLQTVFETPKHPYTIKLLDSEAKGNPYPIKKDAKTILAAENIYVAFSRKKTFSLKKEKDFIAVDHVSLSLKKGETLGIVGESGSGKTTLVFALLNLLEAQGRVLFNGEDIKSYTKKQMQSLRQHLQLIFQDPFGALNPRLSIGQIIGEGLTVHNPKLSKNDVHEQIRNVLKEVHLSDDILSRFPHEFSGGQRQRISLARSLILKPSLLALDEPTSALDRSIQSDILDMLKKIQKKHEMSYLFISHDLAVIKSLSHRVIVMKSGQIMEFGTTEEIMYNPKHDYTKRLIQSAFY